MLHYLNHTYIYNRLFQCIRQNKHLHLLTTIYVYLIVFHLSHSYSVEHINNEILSILSFIIKYFLFDNEGISIKSTAYFTSYKTPM